MCKLSLLVAVIFLYALIGPALYAQQPRDKGVFIESKNEFYEQIEQETAKFKSKPAAPRLTFKLDFSTYNLPKSLNDFTTLWHNRPISQGMAGTCWSFSGTSFLESEIYRLHQKQVKLSELYTVYFEYLEKARRFVQERGNSLFDEGSECNAVTRMWKKYGIVPLASYTGLKPGQKFHDHEAMVAEMKGFLNGLKQSQAWNEAQALDTIRAILNHYLGEPPQTITLDGVTMTPLDYLRNVLKFNPDDYVDVMSLMQHPYYKQAEYDVPDNWWHCDLYYNVPLNDFMAITQNAVRKGYTIAIGGDVSEPGIDGHQNAAIVPAFDIPSAYIDENARQFRFANKTTTDDHGIHLVGYYEQAGVLWFLIKDSGSGSRNGKHEGYYFYHSDFVKLKMMTIMLHKDCVTEILQKFGK